MSELDSYSMSFRKNSFLVFGKGYAENRLGNGWFKYRDLVDAIPDSPAKSIVTPSTRGFSKVADRYIVGGFLEARASEPGTSGTRSQKSSIHVTDTGEGLLLDAITYSVTHKGVTIPELLQIPEAIEAVLVASDIEDRVMRAISGLGQMAVKLDSA